jgi:hypothetical protein
MTLRLNIKLTCPRHRNYDPQKSGEAGIKAGCTDCYRMLRVYRAVIALYDEYGWNAIQHFSARTSALNRSPQKEQHQ